MPSLEQIGLPILIVGAVVAIGSILWLLRVAFSTGFWWGLLLILGHVATVAASLWLLQQELEAPVYLGVLGLAVIPYYFFIARHWGNTWKPALLLVVGLAILASPLAINSYVKHFVPAEARVRNVEGETHVTLTDLKDYDYSSLSGKTDIEVLQMANPDVNDDTLGFLKDLSRLKELDLNDTQITDAGLALLAKLPALQKLRIRNTKITDAGFRQHLSDLERLDELDLMGTAVTGKTARAWKSAKEGRRVLR